jgi:DNA-binding beta-propeller fold protein YncE
MIQSPVSVAFIANGDIVIAESSHRVQVFDRNGRSTRLIGWGNVKPQGVAVSNDGLIAVADGASQTICFFTDDGQNVSLSRRWPTRMFGMPSAVAIAKATGHVIVADGDRHCISVHSPGGAIQVRIGTEQHIGNPTHVAVDDNSGAIYVSDAVHSCVKVFDSSGEFVRQLQLPPPISPSNSQTTASVAVSTLRRPYGLCVDLTGRVAVCDRDSHRIILFSPEGRCLGDLLSAQHGSLRYPYDVAVTQTSDGTSLVAVVESYSGLMADEPHHALKLFAL